MLSQKEVSSVFLHTSTGSSGFTNRNDQPNEQKLQTGPGTTKRCCQAEVLTADSSADAAELSADKDSSGTAEDGGRRGPSSSSRSNPEDVQQNQQIRTDRNQQNPKAPICCQEKSGQNQKSCSGR